VGLAAGEVLEPRAEGLRGHDLQVHLDARADVDRGLSRPQGVDRLDRGEPGEGLGDLGALAGRGEEVEVADGLLVAAGAPGDLGGLDFRELL